MKKIFSLQEAQPLLKELRTSGKSIILVGGCFDLLHFGHIKFLDKAKKAGDVLIVALESDEKIKKTKGQNRPIHAQEKRGQILADLETVDFIILLPFLKKDIDYLNLVKKIKPNMIAVTRGDPKLKNKQKQAKAVKGKVIVVTPKIKTPSTTDLLKQKSHEKT